jgi:hypothetical protein
MKRESLCGLTSRRSQSPLALSVLLSRFTSRVGGGSAFFVMRRYRTIFLLGPFALLGAVLIWLVVTRPTQRQPTMSIGVIRYEPWAGKGGSFKAWIGVTNTGRTGILFSAPLRWLQVESQEGWAPRDLSPMQSLGRRAPTIAWLGPGSNMTVWGLLPEGTQRWRVRYQLYSPSLRDRVTERIPAKWRATLRPLTERLSNKTAEREMRMAVFEFPHNEPPAVDGGTAAGCSLEAPWPAATEAKR